MLRSRTPATFALGFVVAAACSAPEPGRAVGGGEQQAAASPFDARAVEIVDHWTGEGPGPITFAWRLERQGATYAFAGTGTLTRPGTPGGPLAVAVPDAAMRAFLRGLAAAPRTPGEYTPRIEHTDDYPELTIRLRTATGVTEFFSASQGEDHVPWRVDIGARRYVIDSAAPAQALRQILPYLRRDELQRLREEKSRASGG